MEKGSGDFAEVGSGTIDFDRIFAARKKAGMEYWFVEQDECKRIRLTAGYEQGLLLKKNISMFMTNIIISKRRNAYLASGKKLAAMQSHYFDISFRCILQAN